MPEIYPLQVTYAKDKYDKNDIRKEEQEKAYCYYSGDKYNILRYLGTALEKTYPKLRIDQMQLQWVNLTEKLINQLAVVYRNPAKRKLVDKNGKENEEWTKYYNSKLPEDINSEDKIAHRLGRLQNTVLTYVVPDKKTKRLKYKTMSSHFFDVDLDDDGDVIRVRYPRYYKNSEGEEEVFTIVWENERYYMLDMNKNEMKVPGTKDETNPYGDIPYSLLIMKKAIDIWGESQSDIINVNEQVNFLLTKLVNGDIILGTEGTLLGINLGLNTKGQFETSGGLKEITVGLRTPITVETKGRLIQGEPPPSLTHVSFDPKITDIRDTIDWYIKYIASLKGLNPSAILSFVKDTSDYQKIMDAIDQMEIRKDDIEPLRTYEKERFEITRLVNNTHAGTGEYDFKVIPEDLELQIDFAEVEIHKTVQDIWLERKEQAAVNMSTPVDWLMEENPDLTKEEAENQIKENKKINTGIGVSLIQGGSKLAQPSLLESLNNFPPANQGEEDKLGKIPLAVQQLTLSMWRAGEAGNAVLAKEIEKQIKEMLIKLKEI